MGECFLSLSFLVSVKLLYNVGFIPIVSNTRVVTVIT